MPTSRRDFFKLLGVLGAAAATTAIASQLTFNRSLIQDVTSREEEEVPPQWLMVIDLNKCDGCVDKEIPSCLEGCAQHHRIPKRFKTSGEPIEPSEPQPWIEIFEKKDNSLSGTYFLPRPCMHCQSPPCLHVCPTGATFKTKEGVVLINHQVCIGCRMCMAACPYNARSFNWGEPEPWFGTRGEEIAYFEGRGDYNPEFPGPHQKGTVEKCDFCVHNVKEGKSPNEKLPTCVRSCPNGALYYGDLNQDLVANPQETITLSTTVKARLGYRLHEELGTKPHVYYLPKKG